MIAKKVKEKTSKFPRTSGVYLMKNSAGKIIYVGKAANLRSRVRSYFQSHLAPKTASLMAEVNNITFRKTESELDALLMEARLVRELHPKYNIQLTDDKTFPLLAITEEEFPRVFITRERGRRGIRYFGPFINSTDLRYAYRTLQRIFKFRNCRYKKYPKNCLLKHINLCLAPCAGKISPADYGESIRALKGFLSGNKADTKKRLTNRMQEASQKQEYESAAIFRNQLRALENLSQVGKLGSFYEEPLLTASPTEKIKAIQETLGLAKLPTHIEGIDISDIKGTEAVGSVVVFIDGEPANHLYRRFKIQETPEGVANDYSRIKEVLRRRITKLISEKTNVDIILIDGGIGHVKSAYSVLQNLTKESRAAIGNPALAGLAKGTKTETVFLIRNNEIVRFRLKDNIRLLAYVRDEAHRFAQKYHHLRRSRSAFGDTKE